MMRPHPGPEGFRVDGSTVVRLNAKGRDLWRYAMPPTYMLEATFNVGTPQGWIADVDGDGRKELLVNTRPT